MNAQQTSLNAGGEEKSSRGMQRLGIDGAQLTQMWLQYGSLLACTLIRV